MPVVAPPPPAAAVTGRRTCSFEEPASDRHHLKPSSGGGGGGDVRTRSPSVAGRVSVCDVVANSSATGQSGEPANRNRMPSGGGGGVGGVSGGGSVGGTTGAGGLRQSRQQSVESRGSSSIPTATLLAGHHRQVVAGGASGGGGGGSSSNGNSISKTGPIEDGAPLPAAFEPVPLNLYGKPLQEIDPTVRDKVRHYTQPTHSNIITFTTPIAMCIGCPSFSKRDPVVCGVDEAQGIETGANRPLYFVFVVPSLVYDV